MKKKLNEIGIANELSGSSVFFKPVEMPDAEETPETKPRKRTLSARKAVFETNATAPQKGAEEPAAPVQPAPPLGETRGPTLLEPRPTSTPEPVIETIRKAVKRLGKESAFCRFTQEEKNALSDLVYKYKNKGIRTSENEVVRIALNWLIENYHADGKNSVLAQVLDRLNA